MHHRWRSYRATLSALLITLIVLLLIPACASRPKAQQVPSDTDAAAPPPQQTQTNHNTPAPRVWTPAPVSIRIYPSTRFVKEEAQAILEARIELFDQMGDSIKSSGRARCELYAVSGANDTVVGTRLYAWDIDLTTLENQRTFYDPIIRGYVFRLRVDDLTIARHPTLLRVTFHPPSSDRLSTEAVVSADW